MKKQGQTSVDLIDFYAGITELSDRAHALYDNHDEADILLMLHDLGEAMDDLVDYHISRWGTREDREDRDITFQ
tara:strand:- start:1951 stop:2172 length:222 start_codon:yes stop_codon:yes gene_type:complete